MFLSGSPNCELLEEKDPSLKFDHIFWEKYYTDNHVPWDMGHISPPLKTYFDGLTDRTKKILVPGAGNGHEAEYLWKKGFKNVFIVDLAISAIANFRKRVPDFPEANILLADFFEIKGSYDLIIEQTFFCALDPGYRPRYALKMKRLLKTGGRLVGLLFDFPFDPGNPLPPFGGSVDEYKSYFETYFNFMVFETATNSHPARQDREIFIILEKKS